jgi:hypothetical protein
LRLIRLNATWYKQVDKKRKQADANLKKALLLLRSSKDEDFDNSVDLFHEALQQVDDFLIYEDYPQQFDVYFYKKCGRADGGRTRETVKSVFIQKGHEKAGETG